MKRFGLIGKNISHSFSEQFFTQKFNVESISDTSYKTYDVQDISDVEELIENENLNGFNVTIPFKEQIISFLDELSPEAEKIGAVNCVKIQNGKKIGYNTDVYGFEKSIRPLLENHHKQALILGDGGAAKAVKFVLDRLGISHKTVSRKGELKFSDLTKEHIQTHSVLINCTPLGTFPHHMTYPEIPYEFIDEKNLLYDLVYNPEKTIFLEKGEIQNAKIKNGYEMLVLQAEKSWEIWNQLL